MGGPGPVRDLLGLVMALVAAWEAGRLSVATATGRRSERDVDTFHLAMAVSMAFMLSGHLTGFSAEVWAVLFACAAVWFAARTPWAVAVHTDASPSLVHRLSHVVSNVAMVYMLLAMRAMGGGTRLPALAPVLAVLVLGTALAPRGGHPPVSEPEQTPAGGPVSVRRAVGARPFLAPRAATVAELVMGVSMAYLLLAMI